MVTAQRPSEQKTQLGEALAEARREARLLQKDAAALLGLSQPSIARMENGRKPPTRDELQRLLERYDPSQGLRERIMRLACPGEEEHGPGLNQKFDSMLSASEEAVAIHTFHSERIPMTLQCERYALKQHCAADPAVQPLTVLRRLARRTRIFTLRNPPEYHAIMTVSSLLRMPDGQLDLIKDQAQHILDVLDAAPSLTLRVLDLAARIPYIDADFTVLRMPDRKENMVYVPFGLDGQLIKEKAKIEERENYWRMAEQAALTEDETRDLLRVLAEHGLETTALAQRTS
jgi:transcriptional regulator with XRE-family HTH domain